jgi:hypothetical protein
VTLAILAVDGMEDPADFGIGKQRRDGAFRLLRKEEVIGVQQADDLAAAGREAGIKAEAWPPFDLKTGRMRSP